MMQVVVPSSPNSLLLRVPSSFLKCVRPLCRCWCPPAGPCSISFHLSPVSALFRWRCNISIHSRNSLPFRRVSQFFLKMCPPFVSLLVSALFRWPCSVSQVCHCWCPPFSAGDATFVFICLPGLSLSAPGHVAFLFICLPGLVSAGNVAFLFICLPGLSSQLCCCCCPPFPSTM